MYNINHNNRSYFLRPATEKDVKRIRVLVNQAYKELADMGLNYTGTYQDELVTQKRLGEGRGFVLEQPGQIIATVILKKENHFTQLNSAYVSQLAVHPDFKKQGLGSILMDFCEQLANEEKFESMQLDTAKPATHLNQWYLKRGYKIIGETQWEGKTYQSWIFEKKLKAAFRKK